MFVGTRAVGTTVTSGAAASAAAAIPNSSGGQRARYVRVIADTLACIKFGDSTVAATANDLMVSSHADVFNVAGMSHYSVIQVTAAAKVNIVPLDIPG